MSSMSSVAPVPLTPPDLNCNVGQPPGGPEHEVQELLKFKMRWGLPYVLVHWAGHDVLGDTWEPLHNLTNYEEAITTFELAPGRPLPHSVSPPPAAAAAPPPLPQAWFTVDPAGSPGDLHAALRAWNVLLTVLETEILLVTLSWCWI